LWLCQYYARLGTIGNLRNWNTSLVPFYNVFWNRRSAVHGPISYTGSILPPYNLVTSTSRPSTTYTYHSRTDPTHSFPRSPIVSILSLQNPGPTLLYFLELQHLPCPVAYPVAQFLGGLQTSRPVHRFIRGADGGRRVDWPAVFKLSVRILVPFLGAPQARGRRGQSKMYSFPQSCLLYPSRTGLLTVGCMSSPSSLGETVVELNLEREENLEFGRSG
jgi:hypothetical protein